ncbi:MAG: bifunctional glutamate N-acetyltransferase/amino-acid acetyltransferase ArgJ [Dehalococcoidales bacterium]|nr:bifunctional glutamate N-acetyltransferase/amino-acid acetyltransferase ArgJ [Dehalococcoidales bacterium]
MMKQIELVPDGTVTSPQGFSAGAASADVKGNGKKRLDLAILCSKETCAVAGLFTTNKIKSPSVILCQQRVAKGKAKAVVANSGCANASTGAQGLADAAEMTALAAKAVGAKPDEVLIANTGVIGIKLPMARIRKGIKQIKVTPQGGHDFTRAIMTTDTTPKEVAVTVRSGRTVFTIGGVAKGSGMIHPNMATLLVFLTTDAVATPAFLKKALREAAAISFNMISIDGDTSPSDTMLIFANGLAKNEPITAKSPLADVFQQALNEVCVYLAKAVARDGEGATKLIEVNVKGAANLKEARLAARTIVSSNLLKSAVYGNDPNWGRVTAALGRSGARVEESKLDVYMGKIPVLKQGAPVKFDKAKAVAVLKQKEVPITVVLNLGKAEATAWGCDLTEQYVKINAEYTT